MKAQAPMSEEAHVLSKTQSAAILLTVMGENDAASLIKHLSPTEIQRLTEAMLTIADVDQQSVHAALDHFLHTAKSRTAIGHDAPLYVRKVLDKAIGADRSQAILGRLGPSAQKPQMQTLRWLDAKSIVALIKNEHPQVIAACLAHADSDIAATALQMLPEDKQGDIMLRIATLQEMHPDAIDELEQLLQVTLKHQGSITYVKAGGTAFAAQIMNGFARGADQRIIEDMELRNSEILAEIQDQMLVFDNLNALDDRGMQTLMRAIDSSHLVGALKGAGENLRNRMLGCMSQRAAQTVLDEMAAKGPMRVSEVQEAQKEILIVARRLADEGQLMLGGKDDDYL